ncbi:MAG: hypothetical protein KDJ65_22495 [Anaerolineae bacterium]|nr:hypothetical protein [Anaerolineae bacterium]
MTLCAAWLKECERGSRLVLATDSLITGGYTYPYGTKLIVFSRNDCALCWEGDTSFTYSFAENARVDVEFSDHLCTQETPLIAVVRRITKVFNQLWRANLEDKGSVFHRARLSFFFGGYCPVYKKVVLWHIHQVGKEGYFRTQFRHLRQPVFIGSGRDLARKKLRSGSSLSPYQALVQVLEDTTVLDVGGIPQIVVIDNAGAEIIGVIKDGERYLFGRKLDSRGHQAKIRYIAYDNDVF